MTCDMWHVTCDMWHVTNKNFFTHHVAYFWIPYNLRSIQEYTICNKWQVTSDMWHVTSDMWHVSICLSLYHVKYFRILWDTRSIIKCLTCTSDKWYVTCDMWHVKIFLPIMSYIFDFLDTPGVYNNQALYLAK